MNVKKPLLVAGVASSIAFGSMASLSAVTSADTSSSSDGQSSLIDKLASKFNLDKNEVKAVFEADRTEHEAARQKEVETALTQAVKDGKLTSDQKDKILAKRTELKSQMEANRDSMKNKSDAERKAAMDANKAAIDKWASDNGIPQDYIKYLMGGPHGGPGHRAPDSN